MAPWIVPMSTSWGVRRNLRRVRRATDQAVVSRPAGAGAGAIAAAGAMEGAAAPVGWSMVMTVIGSGSLESGRVGGDRRRLRVARVGVCRWRIDRCAGKREEDLVECRPAQRDVADLEAEHVEGPD